MRSRATDRKGVLWFSALLAAACSRDRPAVDAEAVGPPVFLTRIELATEGKPERVCFHDVDGDGRDELLALSRSPGALTMWRDPGAAPTVVRIPDYPLGPEPVVAGPTTRFAVVSRSTRELVVVDLAQGGSIDETSRVAVPGTPRVFTVGVVQPQGEPVAVIATQEGELLVQTPHGFTRSALLEGQPTFVTIAHGLVIVGSQTAMTVRAYEWQEPAGLVSREGVLALDGIPRSYRSLDLGGDGDVESLVAGGDRSLWVAPNWPVPGTGGGDEPWDAATDPLALHSIEVGAIPVDLARAPAEHGATVLSLYDLHYAVVQGDRVGERTYAGQDPWSLAVGELDADGRPDLAVANRGAQRISLATGTAAGSFAAPTNLRVGRGPHALACGDLDADGTLELLAINALDGDLALLSAAAGAYEVVARHDARPAGDHPALADVDGDGALDVAFLVRGAGGARLRLLRGDGTGTLVWSGEDVPVGSSAGDLVLCDADGDGEIEAFAADPEEGRVHVLRPGRMGPTGAPKSLSLDGAPRALAWLGDARLLSVALGEPGPRLGVAFLSFEGGELVESDFLPTGSAPIDVASARRARDGRDLVALLTKVGRGDGPGQLLVYTRRADAWEATFEGPTGLRPFGVAGGDLDGDGALDWVVGAQNSHHVNVWWSSPEGLRRLADLGAGRGVLDVLLADLDGDGRAEVVAANNFSGTLSLIRNRQTVSANASGGRAGEDRR